MMITRFFMNWKVSQLVMLCMLAVLLLAACSPVNNSVTANQSVTASATLKHGPTGRADLAWDPSSQTLMVELSMTGLAPNSRHPAHIHAGSCRNAGKVVYPLQDVVADAHGVATVTTTISNVMSGIPATGWYINVHNGPELTSEAESMPIACGEVSNSEYSTRASQAVLVSLADTTAANQSASGSAQLTLSDGTLTVKLTMSGLAPNSTHMAHIHGGTCSSQGKVVHGLNPVVADASGNGSSTTVLTGISSIPSSGWYVNVHLTMDMSTQTGNDPIACGDVSVG
jgi:hypothetical protein